MAIVAITPGSLNLEDTAAFVSLAESTVQQLVREKKFPQPRQLSGRRVGWLVRELDEWLESRPISELPPPPNTGAKKSKKQASQDDLIAA